MARLLQTSLTNQILIAAFWVFIWYLGAWLTAKRSASWARSNIERENSNHWGACTFMSTINAVVTAGICVPGAVVILMSPESRWFHEPLAPLDSLDWCYDSIGGSTVALVTFAGYSFTIRIAVDMVLQGLHGLLTVEEICHHLIFMSAGVLIGGSCMMPLNSAIMMSMEISTPFLNYYLFFRFRYGFRADVNLAKQIFGVLFLLFRTIFNTYGAVIFLRRCVGPEPALRSDLPMWHQYSVVLLILAGAGQQMYWGMKIVASLMKPTKPLTGPQTPERAKSDSSHKKSR